MSTERQGDFAYLDQPDFREIYVVDAKQQTMRFYVENATCAKCLNRIEGSVCDLPKVTDARLDLGTKVLSVSVRQGGSYSAVAETVRGLGYIIEPLKASQREDENELKYRRREILRMGIAGACAGNIMLLSIAQYAGADKSEFDQYFGWLSLLLFLPVLFYAAVPFYRNTWAGIQARRFAIDLPIVAAVLVSVLFSVANLIRGHGDTYFDAVSALMFLLLASRFWLGHLQRRYLRTLNLYSLLESRIARRWNATSLKYEDVPIERIAAGNRVLVRAGEKFPADGELLSARIHVNSAVLSGEAYPVEVLASQSVFAGTTLVSENAEFIATAINADSRVGRLMASMALEAKARTPLFTFTDRMGQIFTFGVLGVGIVYTAYYWHIDPVAAISRSLALTLLSCPCALALATPLAHSLALLRAAKRGFFIKRSEAIERLPQIENVFFDKTGTLTSGQLSLLSCSPEASPELQSIVMALELKSHHPVARALVKTFSSALPVVLESWSELIGVGVSGKYNGHLYELKASPKSLSNSQVNPPDRIINQISLYRDGQECLQIQLGDVPRPEAAQLIKILESRGIKTHLLTGDREANAKAVAQAVGIAPQHVFAECSPEEKHRLLKAYPHSMMVGDGVNDAVAMAAAHVSVAVQGSMEASLKAADIFISRGGLAPIGEILTLAEETMRVIRRNLVFSLIYNVAGGILAVNGHIDPILAAILMPASSITLLLASLWGTPALRQMSRATEYIQSYTPIHGQLQTGEV